jgi:hypothetical protein
MSWIAKLLSRDERGNGAEKPKADNLHVAELAKQKIEKVIEKPIVRELFQTDDDLGYC